MTIINIDKYNKLLERLDEDSCVGLDLSPGNLLSKEAAIAIRELLNIILKQDILL